MFTYVISGDCLSQTYISGSLSSSDPQDLPKIIVCFQEQHLYFRIPIACVQPNENLANQRNSSRQLKSSNTTEVQQIEKSLWKINTTNGYKVGTLEI